jgi:Tol biopolymer transport system component
MSKHLSRDSSRGVVASGTAAVALAGLGLVAGAALSQSGASGALPETTGAPERAAEAILPMGRLVYTSDRSRDDLDIWMYVAGEPEPIQLTSGRGLDRSPALSPDGRRVAFATDRNNLEGFTAPGSNLRWHDLYTIALDADAPVELVANRRFNSEPAWSPDGSMIAYAGEVIGAEGSGTQIHLVSADGSEAPVAITDDPVQAGSPAWSPDGTRIAFTSTRHGQNEDGSWNREIYVMDADGGREVRLTDDPASDAGPVWSPDGTRILFHSDRAGNDDLYAMAADGSDVVRLTDDPADDDFGDWSPDGTMIAFVSERDGDREIYLMKADGSEQSRLTDNAEDFPEHRGVDDFPSWGP